MRLVKFGFNLMCLISLFNLDFCLECPTCTDEECSTPFNNKAVVLMDCSQGTELPTGFRYSDRKRNVVDDTPSYKCLSVVYHFESNDIENEGSKLFQQCIDTRADDCSDIVVDLPGNIIIDDCDVVDGGDLVLQTTTEITSTIGEEETSSVTDDEEETTSSVTDDEEGSTTPSTTTTEDPGSATSISLSIASIILALVSYLLS